MNSGSTTKEKRAISRWVGETETSSCQKFHSRHGNPQVGEISKIQNLSLKSKGFVPTLGTTQPLGPAPERGTTKMFGLKTNKEYVQEIQRALGNGEHTGRASFETQHKTNSCFFF